MNEYFEKIMAWIKSNVWLSAGIGLLAILLFFPKLLIGTTRRRRRYVRPTATRRRRRINKPSAPRRRTKRNYAKGGAKKKPWQIKGSLAARRYMAKIRRKR